jgi:hypothetical protein
MSVSTRGQKMDDRRTFLMEMYRQMFADINRQMTVVWQAVSVVIGAFALLALVEKNIVPLDIAVSLIVILSAWMYAHMLDGGYWYNRNLAIISNIEKQFLIESDQQDIQYYFGKHRSTKNKMISYFRIQAILALAIATLVLLFHFFVRIVPGFYSSLKNLELTRSLPYIAASASVIILYVFYLDRRNSYKTFVENSPGKAVNTTGVNFGPGHSVDQFK